MSIINDAAKKIAASLPYINRANPKVIPVDSIISTNRNTVQQATSRIIPTAAQPVNPFQPSNPSRGRPSGSTPLPAGTPVADAANGGTIVANGQGGTSTIPASIIPQANIPSVRNPTELAKAAGQYGLVAGAAAGNPAIGAVNAVTKVLQDRLATPAENLAQRVDQYTNDLTANLRAGGLTPVYAQELTPEEKQRLATRTGLEKLPLVGGAFRTAEQERIARATQERYNNRVATFQQEAKQQTNKIEPLKADIEKSKADLSTKLSSYSSAEATLARDVNSYTSQKEKLTGEISSFNSLSPQDQAKRIGDLNQKISDFNALKDSLNQKINDHELDRQSLNQRTAQINAKVSQVNAVLNPLEKKATELTLEGAKAKQPTAVDKLLIAGAVSKSRGAELVKQGQASDIAIIGNAIPSAVGVIASVPLAIARPYTIITSLPEIPKTAAGIFSGSPTQAAASIGKLGGLALGAELLNLGVETAAKGAGKVGEIIGESRGKSFSSKDLIVTETIKPNQGELTSKTLRVKTIDPFTGEVKEVEPYNEQVSKAIVNYRAKLPSDITADVLTGKYKIRSSFNPAKEVGFSEIVGKVSEGGKTRSLTSAQLILNQLEKDRFAGEFRGGILPEKGKPSTIRGFTQAEILSRSPDLLKTELQTKIRIQDIVKASGESRAVLGQRPLLSARELEYRNPVTGNPESITYKLPRTTQRVEPIRPFTQEEINAGAITLEDVKNSQRFAEGKQQVTLKLLDKKGQLFEAKSALGLLKTERYSIKELGLFEQGKFEEAGKLIKKSTTPPENKAFENKNEKQLKQLSKASQKRINAGLEAQAERLGQLKREVSERNALSIAESLSGLPQGYSEAVAEATRESTLRSPQQLNIASLTNSKAAAREIFKVQINPIIEKTFAEAYKTKFEENARKVPVLKSVPFQSSKQLNELRIKNLQKLNSKVGFANDNLQANSFNQANLQALDLQQAQQSAQAQKSQQQFQQQLDQLQLQQPQLANPVAPFPPFAFNFPLPPPGNSYPGAGSIPGVQTYIRPRKRKAAYTASLGAAFFQEKPVQVTEKQLAKLNQNTFSGLESRPVIAIKQQKQSKRINVDKQIKKLSKGFKL